MLRLAVDTCNIFNANKKSSSNPGHTPTEELSLQEIYNLIEKHKLHVCDDMEKVEIIISIKDVFGIIRSCTASKLNSMDSISN